MKQYVDGKYIYGEIKLWRNAQVRNSVAVLVEAKSDEKLFSKLFVENTGFFSTNGHKILISAISIVNKNGDKGIVGIMDADFRRIEGSNFSKENIFLTEGHDLEMMLINSKAWNSVLDFHTDRKKLLEFEEKVGVSFKEYLFNLAKEIANFRYLNEVENLELIFKTFNNKNKPNYLDYSNFINKDTLTIDLKKLMQTVENKSGKIHFFKNNPALEKKLNSICQKKYDSSDFCNGHDLTNIFSLSLVKVISNKRVSSSDIVDQMIIAYRFDDFKLTKLFSTLILWEKESIDYTLLTQN